MTLLSRVYGWLGRLRTGAYQRGWLKRIRLLRPVVSVGNLSVGGAGKTPVTAYLARLLLREGRKPAILSRGYRSEAEKSNLLVSSGKEPATAAVRQAGDEALMLARQVPEAMLGVGRRRERSAGLILGAAADPGPLVFILEDGFQHLRLYRNVDLLLLEADDPRSEGRLLREPLRAARRADALLLTRCHLLGEDELAVAGDAARSLNPEAPLFRFAHRPVGWTEVPSGRRFGLDEAPGESALALAALARPRQFVRDLSRLGIKVAGEHFYRDHHWYRQREVDQVVAALRGASADFIATTEKDAVRLEELELPPDKIFALGIEAYCLDEEAFKEWLLSQLEAAC